jgi:hypothetical protein
LYLLFSFFLIFQLIFKHWKMADWFKIYDNIKIDDGFIHFCLSNELLKSFPLNEIMALENVIGLKHDIPLPNGKNKIVNCGKMRHMMGILDIICNKLMSLNQQRDAAVTSFIQSAGVFLCLGIDREVIKKSVHYEKYGKNLNRLFEDYDNFNQDNFKMIAKMGFTKEICDVLTRINYMVKNPNPEESKYYRKLCNVVQYGEDFVKNTRQLISLLVRNDPNKDLIRVLTNKFIQYSDLIRDYSHCFKNIIKKNKQLGVEILKITSNQIYYTQGDIKYDYDMEKIKKDNIICNLKAEIEQYKKLEHQYTPNQTEEIDRLSKELEKQITANRVLQDNISLINAKSANRKRDINYLNVIIDSEKAIKEKLEGKLKKLQIKINKDKDKIYTEDDVKWMTKKIDELENAIQKTNIEHIIQLQNQLAKELQQEKSKLEKLNKLNQKHMEKIKEQNIEIEKLRYMLEDKVSIKPLHKKDPEIDEFLDSCETEEDLLIKYKERLKKGETIGLEELLKDAQNQHRYNDYVYGNKVHEAITDLNKEDITVYDWASLAHCWEDTNLKYCVAYKLGYRLENEPTDQLKYNDKIVCKKSKITTKDMNLYRRFMVVTLMLDGLINKDHTRKMINITIKNR